MVEGSFVPELCPVGVGAPKEEDMEMIYLVDSGMDLFDFKDV